MKIKDIAYTAIVVVMVILSSGIVFAPPSPHNVDGRILSNSSNGVADGMLVYINETVSKDYRIVEVSAPPVPQLMGSYSSSINGTTGDLTIVFAYNSTNYGMSNLTLLGTTTTIDVVLNHSRDSEANVTIISPSNNTLKNKFNAFNVTANVTMLGRDAVNCNATISFTDEEILNVTIVNKTVQLGDINYMAYKIANWSVVGNNNGSINFTIRVDCSTDGFNIEHLNVKSRSNITIFNSVPRVTRVVMDNPVDLAPGLNLSLACNATIQENNTILDIRVVNATFFQKSIGHSAPDDNNNHYTNTTCLNYSSGSYESNYTCTFKVAYYANNGTWQCNVTVSDYSNLTNSSNTTTSVNELLAIDVFPTIIDYGKLQVFNISNDINVTMRNFGNMPINLSVRAFAPNESLGYLNLSMNCEDGNNISNSNERFSINYETPYPSMSRMSNETQIIKNITLQQRINDIAFGDDINFTYWKLQIPSMRPGICNGTVVFGAYPAYP